MSDDIKFTIRKDPFKYQYKIEIDIDLDALELEMGRDPAVYFIEKMNEDFREIILEFQKMYIEQKFKGRYTYVNLSQLRSKSEEGEPKETCKGLLDSQEMLPSAGLSKKRRKES